jgi:hypothetical protein
VPDRVIHKSVDVSIKGKAILQQKHCRYVSPLLDGSNDAPALYAEMMTEEARILITGDGFESLLRGITEKQSEVDRFASLADAESRRDLKIILDDLAEPIDRINKHIHKLQDNLKGI